MDVVRAQAVEELFDAHCHPLESPSEVHRVATRSLRTKFMAVQTSKEAEWAPCVALAAANSCVFPGFGVHPWFAHRAEQGLSVVLMSAAQSSPPGWLQRMRSLIESTPCSFVGEIGLDKAALTEDDRNEFAAQVPVFVAQLELAHELQKPVSVHAVQCWGAMFDILSKLYNCTAPIWSGGSLDFAKLLLALEKKKKKKSKHGTRFYFSFSVTINGRAPKTEQVIASIPADRLLIESDENTASHIDEAMDLSVEFVSRARGWTPSQTVHTTTQNAMTFYAAPSAQSK